MNETDLKTRHGLIMEALIERAMNVVGITGDRGFQYDPGCEIPDFLIPDSDKPRIMIEVHQTDYENSFMMKILRAFTAVAEAKIFYGHELSAVNILMGNPNVDLPSTCIKSLNCFFDKNIILRELQGGIQLEEVSLKYAYDDALTCADAASKIKKDQKKIILQLGKEIKKELKNIKPRVEIKAFWKKIKKDNCSYTKTSDAGAATYFKRGLYSLLLLPRDIVNDLFLKKDPNLLDENQKVVLGRHKLATFVEDISGDIWTLSNEITFIIKEERFRSWYEDCLKVSSLSDSFKWYTEDIRDHKRRMLMADTLLNLTDNDKLQNAIYQNLTTSIFSGIQHSRAWIIDLLAISLGTSQNDISREIVRLGVNPGQLRRPLSHITPKTERFKSLTDDFKKQYAFDIVNAVEAIQLRTTATKKTSNELADALRDFRLDNAIKLQSIDPMIIVISQIVKKLGLTINKVSVDSIINDLVNEGSGGRFEVYEIHDTKTDIRVLLNAVAVHDNNGDHKSKEWGARRLTTLYRIENGLIVKSKYQKSIFILDGEWKDKDVERLSRSGWSSVIRLPDLECTLKKVFGTKSPPFKILPLNRPQFVSSPKEKLAVKRNANG